MSKKHDQYARMLKALCDAPHTIQELSSVGDCFVRTAAAFVKSLGNMVYVAQWKSNGRTIATVAAYKFTLKPRKDAAKPMPLTRREIDQRYHKNKKMRVASVFDIASRHTSSRAIAACMKRGDDGRFLFKSTP